MQVTKKNLNDTTVQLAVVADVELLAQTKEAALRALARDVRLPGFRQGKAPLNLIEKNVNPTTLQTEFLDRVLNQLYVAAIDAERLRPVAQPKVSVKKFVPFTTLEVEFETEAVGDVKLPDYKKIKLAKTPATVTAKDVDKVVAQLRARAGERQETDRAAKEGDEVTIDFTGTDAKTGEPVQGADGKAYPLVLGSNSFIPGFEPELVGLKAGGDKTFVITFPKDYGVSALQNRKVQFAVHVQKVSEVQEPKLDDAFAAKVGPFKTMTELKQDIKKQLEAEKQTQADRDFESQLLEQIADKTSVAIPQALIDEEIDRLEAGEKQNLAYRGQTWQEHLKDEGVTEAEHREQKRPAAERRIKAGLTLGEIAEAEGLTVTPEELEIRLQLLKGQYQDKQMQAELDKPENRRDIASRLLTEKTLQKLTAYATTK